MALSIGSSIPIFNLPATDGKTYGVTDLMGRNATVIISAPLASAQARFCSKLAYLPLPMMSRDWNVWLPRA